MSKPILTFLNSQYPSDSSAEATDIRNAVEGVHEVSFREIASKPSVGFSYTAPKKKEKKTKRISFDAKVVDLDKVRIHLRRPNLSPSDIGKLTFAHYIKTECGAN